MTEQLLFSILIFAVAFFYASVGHGGGSGYLALMSVFNFPLAQIKPSVLILNIFVSSISFYHFFKQSYFRWRLFWPFVVLSIPLAFLGSFIALDPKLYKQILGFCLIVAVLRIFGVFGKNNNEPSKPLPILPAVLIGGTIGFLSGIIGIGGGIFLSPIILIFNWGSVKETAAVSSLFIVINSISGLMGFLKQGFQLDLQLYVWILIAFFGGYLGAFWGSKRAFSSKLKNILAVVLAFAGLKLIFI